MNVSDEYPPQIMAVGVLLVSWLCMGCSEHDDRVPPAPSDVSEPADAAAESETVLEPDMDAESETTEADVVSADDNPDVDPEGDPSPASITLESGTWEDVQARVAESSGKVVVVDLWSTSCLPCIKELPYLGELQREHPDEVVCISLSVDYLGIKSKPPEYYRERVELVLKKCEVDVRNYLCTTDVDTVFNELELASIPAVYVYGTDGILAQRFDSSMLSEDSVDEEPFSYEADVVPLVERLVAADE